jgi:hypothetical protein
MISSPSHPLRFGCLKAMVNDKLKKHVPFELTQLVRRFWFLGASAIPQSSVFSNTPHPHFVLILSPQILERAVLLWKGCPRYEAIPRCTFFWTPSGIYRRLVGVCRMWAYWIVTLWRNPVAIICCCLQATKQIVITRMRIWILSEGIFPEERERRGKLTTVVA